MNEIISLEKVKDYEKYNPVLTLCEDLDCDNLFCVLNTNVGNIAFSYYDLGIAPDYIIQDTILFLSFGKGYYIVNLKEMSILYQSNGGFIANARQDIPWLINEIYRLNRILCDNRCEDIDVSQFMMCKSKSNLKEYGGKLINLKKENRGLYQSVLNKYYPNTEHLDIWVIKDFHDLCDEVLDYGRFITSDLYHLLNDLYDLCEWMILWYGGEYDDLKEVCTKDEFLDIVRHCIEAPCCEIYVKVRNNG